MKRAGWAALLAVLAPVPALAQAFQCQAPPAVAMPAPVRPDGPIRRSPISGYTLAVSWSPEFCRGGAAARDPGNYQCNGAIGRFGFVLHGLWPDSGGGKYPQWCALTPRPSEDDIKANLCMTPVPWLLEHEWAKHGSCMAQSPAAYFKVAAILWNSLRLPDADTLSRRPALTMGDLRQAFIAANPGWRQDQIGIRASNGGWLREMHLCYGRNFKPARCEPRTYGPGNAVPLKVWRGL